MPTVEDIYNRHLNDKRRTICGHLKVLRELASHCDVVVEFGVRFCASTSALLMGVKGRLYSYDIEQLPQHTELRLVAGDKWKVTYERSEKANIPHCDMLFHDSFHNYAQVKAELDAHANKVRKYLVFHDSVKNAISGGENHTRGNFNPDLAGFRLAVDELMIRDPSWFIKAHYPHDDGLLVLERR